MFHKRREVRLGGYDQRFAAAYKLIGDELTDWRATCELWDHAAEARNRLVARIVKWAGIVGVVVAAVALLVLAGAMPAVAYVVACAAGLLAGAGRAPR